MDIVQVIPDSFQEYEGEQAAVFFVRDCNMECKWCHNRSALNKLPVIGEFLSIYKQYITPLTTAIVFLGGEPTTSAALAFYIKIIKMEHPYIKVKVYSNGTDPERIQRCIDCGADAFSIDYKGSAEYSGKVDYLSDRYGSGVSMEGRVVNSILAIHNARPVSLDIRVTTHNAITTDDITFIETLVADMHKFQDHNCKLIYQECRGIC